MSFASRPPRHPLLVGLVDRLWHSAAEPVTNAYDEWVLPTCRPQMILTPAGSLLAGPQLRATKIERRIGDPMVGVSMTAGALPAILGIGGDEACGVNVELESLWPVGSLPHQLAEEAADAALDRIEASLVSLLQPEITDPTVQAVENAIRGGMSASEATVLIGADRRTFVPKFRKFVGASPKHYERICRFNQTVEAIRQTDAAPLATLAAEQGYADQAHLSREIRHFASTSPSRLHRDGSVMVNHVESDKIFKTSAST